MNTATWAAEVIDHIGGCVTERFQKALRLMRRHDPQAREDGFNQLRPHAGEHLDDLIAAFRQASDHGLRCWLLELIGEARLPRALSVLVEELYGAPRR